MAVGIDKILKEINDNVDMLDTLGVNFDSMDNTSIMAALIMLIKRIEIASRRIDILKDYIINKDKEFGGEEVGNVGD